MDLSNVEERCIYQAASSEDENLVPEVRSRSNASESTTSDANPLNQQEIGGKMNLDETGAASDSEVSHQSDGNALCVPGQTPIKLDNCPSDENNSLTSLAKTSVETAMECPYQDVRCIYQAVSSEEENLVHEVQSNASESTTSNANPLNQPEIGGETDLDKAGAASDSKVSHQTDGNALCVLGWESIKELDNRLPEKNNCLTTTSVEMESISVVSASSNSVTQSKCPEDPLFQNISDAIIVEYPSIYSGSDVCGTTLPDVLPCNNSAIAKICVGDMESESINPMDSTLNSCEDLVQTSNHNLINGGKENISSQNDSHTENIDSHLYLKQDARNMVNVVDGIRLASEDMDEVCNENPLKASGHCDTNSGNGAAPLPLETASSNFSQAAVNAVMNTDNSDDTTDEITVVNEISAQNVQFMNAYRGPVVPYSDTDDSESSSSTSSSDSSSGGDDSSDTESEESDSSTAEIERSYPEKSSPSPKVLKVKGELDIEDLPPIQDLHISVRNDQAAEIGKVLHIVDTLVVVECYKDQPPLDLESVLFLDEGARPLGRIFDVMGPVSEPLYCVRFNSKQHIQEHNVQPGMLVYCAPHTEHSNFVFVQKLIAMKGSDASWRDDKETPLSHMDFSDDEEESKCRKKVTSVSNIKDKECSAQPKPKVARTTNPQLPGGRHPGTPRMGGPSSGYRPRNPWGWPGAQADFSSKVHQQQPQNLTSSQSNPYPRGPVMPSSFAAGFQTPYLNSSDALGPNNINDQRNCNPHLPFNSSNQPRFPGQPCNESQFGRQSDPRQFSQLPYPNPNNQCSPWASMPGPDQRYYQQQNICNSYSQSLIRNEQPSLPNQGNFRFPHAFNSNSSLWTPNHVPALTQGNCPPRPFVNSPSQPNFPGGVHHQDQNTENQRFMAFQSEIARLVEAYNSGAGSPMAVPPPSFPVRPHLPPHSSAKSSNEHSRFPRPK